MSNIIHPFSEGNRLPTRGVASMEEETRSDLLVDTHSVLEEESQGGRLTALIHFLTRHLILISVATAISAGVAYRQEQQKPRTFRGDFQLIVEPLTEEERQADPASVAEQSRSRSGGFDYSSHLTVLQSPGLLSQIAEQAEVDVSVGNLQNRLDVERVTSGRDNTRIIRVEYSGSDPDQVQAVLEAAAQVYLQYSLDIRRSSISEGIGFVDDQVAELRQRYEVVQTSLQDFLQQNSVFDPSQEANQLALRLDSVTSEQESVQLDIREKIALQARLQGQLNLTLDEAIAVSILNEDPLYNQLKDEVQGIDQQIAKETARFEPGTPIVQALIEEKNSLVSLLQQRQQEALGSLATRVDLSKVEIFQSSISRNLNQQFVDVSNELQSLQLRAQELENLRQPLSQRAQAFPALIREHDEMQRELGIVESTLDQLLSRRESFLIQEAQTQIPWELISPPSIPRNADGDAIPRHRDSDRELLQGAIFGFVVGVVLALIMERLYNRVLSVSHVGDVTRLPMLMKISRRKLSPAGHSQSRPRLPSGQQQMTLSSQSIDVTPLYQPAEDTVELFNSLYSALTLTHGLGLSVRSLAICSTSPEAKTAEIALHLARTAEAMDQWTLLVDADLRDPHLHSLIGQDNTRGLGDLLEVDGEDRTLNYIVRLSEKLFVLTAGEAHANPAHLLGSQRMKKLMNMLDMKFEVVIYSTSPLGGKFSDTKLLLPNVDSVLLAVPVGKARLAKTQSVIKELGDIGISVTGTIAIVA